MELFWKILTVVLAAVIPILGGYVCNLLHKLAGKAEQATKSDRAKALIREIDGAVSAAVKYVNQTFVDELKKAGEFSADPEYAEEAFREAYETAIETISSEALDYIEATFGDVRKYLEVKIEDSVHDQKRG